MPMTIDDTLTMMSELLTQEEHSGPIVGLPDLQRHQERRTTIRTALQQVDERLRTLRERMTRLSRLPTLTEIRWAQAVRAMPNLVFLELDTTGLYTDAEIIRIVLLDSHGDVRFDRFARPSQPLSETITRLTGIANEQVQEPTVQPLAEVLEQVRSALAGTYL